MQGQIIVAGGWNKIVIASLASSVLTAGVLGVVLLKSHFASEKLSIEVRSTHDLQPYVLSEAGEFLFRDYPINKSYSDGGDKVVPPPSWIPRPIDGNLDAVLPTPWAKVYSETRKQNFAPSAFAVNMAMLCSYASSHPESQEAVKPIIYALISRLMEYTTPEADALFVRYDFPHKGTKYPLKSGWVSALANGFVLRGLMHAHKCLGEQRIMELADKFANAFRIVNTGDKASPWFVYIDDFGFLWFDEYPVDGHPSFVLNGHIHAILGLVAYYKNRPEEWVRRIIQGGITTMREYGHLYRRKGQVNRYSLSNLDMKDYLPSRTVTQQQLFRITADPYFAAAAKAYEEDFASQ